MVAVDFKAYSRHCTDLGHLFFCHLFPVRNELVEFPVEAVCFIVLFCFESKRPTCNRKFFEKIFKLVLPYFKIPSPGKNIEAVSWEFSQATAFLLYFYIFVVL
jgi:hypothetical protein